MPTKTRSPYQAVQEAIPGLQHTAAVLEILQEGLNDPIDAIHLYAWRDVTEISLQHEVVQLYRSIDQLLAIVAGATEEGTS